MGELDRRPTLIPAVEQKDYTDPQKLENRKCRRNVEAKKRCCLSPDLYFDRCVPQIAKQEDDSKRRE